MAFRRIRRSRALLVIVALLCCGAPRLSLATTDRARIDVAGWGTIRTDVVRLGVFPDGSDHLVATYVFENPESGRDERVGLAPAPHETRELRIVRTGSHVDLAIGNRSYQRLPRFGEWRVFEARPGAFLSRHLPHDDEEEASAAERHVATDADDCWIEAIEHDTQTMRVRCRMASGGIDVVYRREGFESTWRIDEERTLEAVALAAPEAKRSSTSSQAPPLPAIELLSSVRHPLHRAIERGDPAAFLAVLRASSSLEERDDEGNTPLHLAVAKDQSDLVLALLLMGADPLAENAAGLPATGDPNRRNIGAYERKRLHAHRTQIESFAKGQRPHPEYAFAQASFFIAASRSAETLLRWSVDAGADPDWPRSVEGETALHQASDPEVVGWLAELGADPDVADENSRTPLMHAALEGQDRIVDALLVAGARLDVRGRNGSSALTYAIRRSRNADTATVRTLLAKGAPITRVEFEDAMYSRNPRTLRLLFEFGGTFDPTSSDGLAILEKAQQSGGEQIDAVLRGHPEIGPAMQEADRANELERTRQYGALAAAVAPYATLFGLFLGAVPFFLALAAWTWVAKPFAHTVATAALATAAVVLAYFPGDVREALASFRLLGTPTTWLPHLLAALAVVVMLATAATIAPAVFLGLRRKGASGRGALSRVVAGTLSFGLFGLLVLHNLERVDVVDRVHGQLIRILQSIPHAVPSSPSR